MHAPAASQGGKTRKRSPWDLTMAAGGMVMEVLSEGEGGVGGSGAGGWARGMSACVLKKA